MTLGRVLLKWDLEAPTTFYSALIYVHDEAEQLFDKLEHHQKVCENMREEFYYNLQFAIDHEEYNDDSLTIFNEHQLDLDQEKDDAITVYSEWEGDVSFAQSNLDEFLEHPLVQIYPEFFSAMRQEMEEIEDYVRDIDYSSYGRVSECLNRIEEIVDEVDASVREFRRNINKERENE